MVVVVRSRILHGVLRLRPALSTRVPALNSGRGPRRAK